MNKSAGCDLSEVLGLVFLGFWLAVLGLHVIRLRWLVVLALAYPLPLYPPAVAGRVSPRSNCNKQKGIIRIRYLNIKFRNKEQTKYNIYK